MALLVQPFYSISLWFSDQLFTSEPPSPNIVIAGIDDNTLEAYGRWAHWPRSLHTLAIDNLSQAGANVIGFDVIFTDRLTRAVSHACGDNATATVTITITGVRQWCQRCA